MAESRYLKWQDKNGDMLPDECPAFPRAPDVCLNCSPNPIAPVPDWKLKDQYDPFLNQKLCVYHITFVTKHKSTGYEDGMTDEEAEEALFPNPNLGILSYIAYTCTVSIYRYTSPSSINCHA